MWGKEAFTHYQWKHKPVHAGGFSKRKKKGELTHDPDIHSWAKDPIPCDVDTYIFLCIVVQLTITRVMEAASMSTNEWILKMR